jgi:matrixin
VDALAARSPGLAALPAQRLGDATPYAIPLAGELIWFLCRFDAGSPIRVQLPENASEAELARLRLALRAWEQALGVRFEEAGPAQIEIEFAPDDAEFAAVTEAECRVDGAAQAARAGPRLTAALSRARVSLRRAQIDTRGHHIQVDEAQQVGAALHELGHALGYQGHAARGDTVMVRTVETVRDVGARVLAGRTFRDDTLAALYRVESGVVVARASLPDGRSGPVDRLAALAAREGDGSLLVRTGDRSGRVAFVDPSGSTIRVFLRNLPESLRDPRRLELAADPAVFALPDADR